MGDPGEIALPTTGDARLDAQHIVLAKLLSGLLRQIKEGYPSVEQVEVVLLQLRGYAAHHFEYEEQLMMKSGCPADLENRLQHYEFLKRLNQTEAYWLAHHAVPETITTILETLNQWLRNHVCNVDCRIRSALRGRKP